MMMSLKSYNCRQFEDSVRLVAEVALPSKRRSMRVFSNQPGLQLYTGNFLPRAGMRGKVRPAHCAHLSSDARPSVPGRGQLHAPRRALPRDSELPRLREQPRQLPERRAAARPHLRAPAGGAAAGLAGAGASHIMVYLQSPPQPLPYTYICKIKPQSPDR